MPKTSTPIEATVLTEAMIETKQAEYEATSTALATMNSSAVRAASELGYTGTITVGALEDEIRFYKKQSVIALLEMGQRLIILKELTPHGEFKQRTELLGISYRSAARIMQVALKTSKSANLALLANDSKNVSAFLELVTHDDDVIENLATLDDFDKMSASQLREKARELKRDLTAKDEVIGVRTNEANKLRQELSKKVVAPTDWPDAFTPLLEQTSVARRNISKALQDLATIQATALTIEFHESEEPSRDAAFAALAKELGNAYDDCAQSLDKGNSLFENSLAAWKL